MTRLFLCLRCTKPVLAINSDEFWSLSNYLHLSHVLMKAILFLVSLVLSLAAHAEIYKFVDESGQVTYTNLPRHGAKKLNLEPAATTAVTESSSTTRKREAASSSTPSNFPRVDSSTQRKRDDVRRTVLEIELKTEQRNLAEAHTAQQEGEKLRANEKSDSVSWKTRVAKLRDAVKQHEDNVVALKRELASIK